MSFVKVTEYSLDAFFLIFSEANLDGRCCLGGDTRENGGSFGILTGDWGSNMKLPS